VEWSLQRDGSIPFVSLGLDLSRVSATEHRTNFARSGAVTEQAEVSGKQQFAGLFAQASWRPSDRVEVLGSARLDHYQNLDGVESVEGGAITHYPNARSTQFDPRLSMRYATSARSAIRGSVYRAFKAPTLRELYRTTVSSNTITKGNPFLGPETLVGGEVGFEWATGRSRVEVNVYRNEIEGLRARAPVPGQPPNVIQQMNLGTSRSQGLELITDTQVTRALSIGAAYTYADSVVTDDPDPALVGKLIPEVVPHIGTVNIRYRALRGTTVDLRGRFLGRSYAEATNSVASPAHQVIDLYVSHPLREGLDVFAVLENAFDEDYFYAVSRTTLRNGQPRTFTAGVRWAIPFGRSTN
jgi:outer membrane receptor protein involved in Fe transport